jgi:RimJ/RimL family protein N-acetyltransferase
MANAGKDASSLRFKPLSKLDALALMSWRYPSPYSAYDLDSQEAPVLDELLRPENRYHAMVRGDEIIGFFCLGPDARIPGWNYDGSALDLGMGLRPDWTGHGEGYGCLTAVIAFVEKECPGMLLRATVLAWNQRALRLCQRAGFRPVAAFKKEGLGAIDCIVLLRSVCANLAVPDWPTFIRA